MPNSAADLENSSTSSSGDSGTSDSGKGMSDDAESFSQDEVRKSPRNPDGEYPPHRVSWQDENTLEDTSILRHTAYKFPVYAIPHANRYQGARPKRPADVVPPPVVFRPDRGDTIV